MRNRPHPLRKKHGAALIIVLGFLAILTIMALAFAMQMRTERLSGRAYIENARTRQLLHSALARALAEIDGDSGTNFPSFLAAGSPAVESADPPLRGSVRFEPATEYFPAGNALLSNAYVQAVNAAHWQSVPENSPEAAGRIGYVIINTSGLLDANSVGGLENGSSVAARNEGLSPAELQLSPDLLPELAVSSLLVHSDGTITEAESPGQAFIYNRTNAWHHFETVRDIKQLNSPSRGNVIRGPVASFSTFSLFPQSPDNRINLNGPFEVEEFKSRLIRHCGLRADEAQAVYENLLDYTDTNSIPVNILGSSPEAVPMINEIRLENFDFSQHAHDTTNVAYDISGDLFVESWFPFAGEPPKSELELFPGDPAANADGAVEIVEGREWIGTNNYIVIHAAYTNGADKAFILELEPQETETSADGAFSTAAYTFSYSGTIQLEEPFAGDTAPEPAAVRAGMEAIEIAGLDRVEEVSFRIPYTEVPAARSASCIDPRVNQSFSDPDLWDTEAPATPNAINHIDDWGEEAALADKTAIRFYVRNGPMKNAAELGRLSIGKPWSTIRLYSPEPGFNRHPVLDYFDAGEPLWDDPVRPGRINRNSPHTAVLATAFFDAPLRSTPDGPATARVSPEQARVLADNLRRLTARQPQTDWSSCGLAVSNNLPGWTELTDAQKDSIVAGSYRLFGWRDTLFTILLAAQSGTDFDGDGRISDDEVRGSQEAIVYVWRDPATGKAAVVFYGLNDTLQSGIGGGDTWGTLLQDFRP